MTIETKMSSQNTIIWQFTSLHIPTIQKTQLKLKLRCRVIDIIVAARSSRQVQDGVDEVVSRACHRVVILRTERHIN
jgi:hypothetical protein